MAKSALMVPPVAAASFVRRGRFHRARRLVLWWRDFPRAHFGPQYPGITRWECKREQKT
ncbi:hypothetical protein KCP75_25665 [Salmonella enterica subsp. enterica]|nr:hypothetical protein KCP75_25665 [Salmonella enterica subsp. enterica]